MYMHTNEYTRILLLDYGFLGHLSCNKNRLNCFTVAIKGHSKTELLNLILVSQLVSLQFI
jgi:hypothetical protein